MSRDLSTAQIEHTVAMLEAHLVDALRVSQEASDLLEPWRALLRERQQEDDELL